MLTVLPDTQLLGWQSRSNNALDAMAQELSEGTVSVKRQGDELAIVDQPMPMLDTAGFKQSKIDSLLKREARKRWTPWENWQVIGCKIGGICLIHVAGLGLIPLAIGILRGTALMNKYKAAVRADYPTIFDSA